jgi:hypothetical protein
MSFRFMFRGNAIVNRGLRQPEKYENIVKEANWERGAFPPGQPAGIQRSTGILSRPGTSKNHTKREGSFPFRDEMADSIFDNHPGRRDT